VSSFGTLPAWEAGWVITRGLRAGRLPLIESSQRIDFYETAPSRQPARTCPDIIKDHTVSQRSLVHVRSTGFRKNPSFSHTSFHSRNPTTSGKKHVDNMSRHAHCEMNLADGVPAGWEEFMTHPRLVQIPQMLTCNWWWITGKSYFLLVFPLRIDQTVPEPPFHLHWMHSKPARRGNKYKNFPERSQHITTSI